MNASTEKRTPAVCPLCGQIYDARPALSRADGKTSICPDCGIREALTASKMPPKEQEKILAIIHKHVNNIKEERDE